MAYTALTFVSGEVLTAVKMNLLAANDASFHDGTGIGDATIKASALALTATSITATLAVGGSASEVQLNKIDIGGGLMLLTGVVYGAAPTVTSGALISVRMNLKSDPISACLGGIATVYQNSQSGSFTRYSRIRADGSVDAYCSVEGNTNNIFYMNYLSVCKG